MQISTHVARIQFWIIRELTPYCKILYYQVASVKAKSLEYAILPRTSTKFDDVMPVLNAINHTVNMLFDIFLYSIIIR
jgi:hypothetical protein